MKRKMKGFTLIEMIITITVIIILSAISVPIYKNYQQDAIMAEGYVLLGAIREAQKQYYSEWGNFLLDIDSSAESTWWTNNEEVLGIDARGNKYFTWFNVGAGGSGGGNGRTKYYSHAGVMNPPELRNTHSDKLVLQYNLSLGQRFIDYPKTSLDGWF